MYGLSVLSPNIQAEKCAYLTSFLRCNMNVIQCIRFVTENGTSDQNVSIVYS